MSAPDLLTTAQVCERLGKSQSTVQRMVASGRLTPTVQAPGPTGAMLFATADVDALAEP